MNSQGGTKSFLFLKQVAFKKTNWNQLILFHCYGGISLVTIQVIASLFDFQLDFMIWFGEMDKKRFEQQQQQQFFLSKQR